MIFVGMFSVPTWLVIVLNGRDRPCLCARGYRLLVLNPAGEVLNRDRLNFRVSLLRSTCSVMGRPDFSCVTSDSSVLGVIFRLCRLCRDRAFRCPDSLLFFGLASSERRVKCGGALFSVPTTRTRAVAPAIRLVLCMTLAMFTLMLLIDEVKAQRIRLLVWTSIGLSMSVVLTDMLLTTLLGYLTWLRLR